MVYKVTVDWYDDFDKKEKVIGMFLIADSYSDATNKIVKYFGEDDISEFKITPWSPDDFMTFDLSNPDMDWLFHKVDKDVGETIIW